MSARCDSQCLTIIPCLSAGHRSSCCACLVSITISDPLTAAKAVTVAAVQLPPSRGTDHLHSESTLPVVLMQWSIAQRFELRRLRKLQVDVMSFGQSARSFIITCRCDCRVDDLHHSCPTDHLHSEYTLPAVLVTVSIAQVFQMRSGLWLLVSQQFNCSCAYQ